MFLYVPDQAQSTASSAPRFTASLNDNSDDWCFGFDSEQLAAALNTTTDSLFQANRHRELTLENVEASTPDGEMALIKRYSFRVGPSETSLSVQTLGQAGSAQSRSPHVAHPGPVVRSSLAGAMSLVQRA